MGICYRESIRRQHGGEKRQGGNETERERERKAEGKRERMRERVDVGTLENVRARLQGTRGSVDANHDDYVCVCV